VKKLGGLKSNYVIKEEINYFPQNRRFNYEEEKR